MKQYLVLGVAAVLILAAVGCVMLSNVSGDDEPECGATIFICEAGTDKVYAADVDITGKTLTETIFGPGRSAQFHEAKMSAGQLAAYTKNVPTLQFEGTYYQIWTTVSIKMSSQNLQEINDIKAKFFGYAGDDYGKTTPDNQVTDRQLAMANLGTERTVEATVDQENKFYLGETITLSQDASGNNNGGVRWDTFKYSDSDYSKSANGHYLPGWAVAGSILCVIVTVTATDTNGQTVTSTVGSEIQIVCSSYGGIGGLSVTVTDMGVGGV